jgi:hypothetical protein
MPPSTAAPAMALAEGLYLEGTGLPISVEIVCALVRELRREKNGIMSKPCSQNK